MANKKNAPPEAGPLPTVAIPQVVSQPQKTGVALPPKVAISSADASVAQEPASALPAEPVERRLYTLHALVVQQTLDISALRAKLAELEKRIEDFNKRSPHSI